MDKETRDEFTEIKEWLKSIHDKLFIGNGQPPITVQLDRLNRFKGLSYWIYGALFIACLGLIARLLYGFIVL